MTGQLPGPVYGSWDEALADPGFDPFRPWFVAPQDPPAPAADFVWPAGWVAVGATDDTDDGVWTEAEVERIRRRATDRAARLAPYID